MERVGSIDSATPGALEFFAGIGLARIGLEAAGFRVTWANDFDPDKKAMYEAQFEDAGDHVFALGDIGKITADELPRNAALAWASSPCTDLSLAGGRAGLAGIRSGTFWHFIRLLEELEDGRPQIAVLENVTGLATSHGGDDLIAAIRAFNGLGYSVDALAIDARRFLPQSRPRLFLVGAQNPPANSPERDFELRPDWLQWIYDDSSLHTHRALLPLPPAPRIDGLHRLVEDLPADDDRWWGDQRVESFVASLSPVQRERLDVLKSEKGTKYRTAYRRTRRGIPVWEMRPDDISGCLRTARGGSSKQAVVKLGDGRIQIRWMTPLEYARLMGAENYDLSKARTNQALFGFGDAVAVPAVTWLAENYLLPLLRGQLAADAAFSSAAL